MLLAYIRKSLVLYSRVLPCQKAAVGHRRMLASPAAVEAVPTDLSLLPHRSGLPSCHGEISGKSAAPMNIQASLLDAAVCSYFRWPQHTDKPACPVSGVN